MSIDCQMDGNKCSLVKFISQEKYLSQRIVIEMTSQMNGQVYLELGTQIWDKFTIYPLSCLKK